MVGTNRLEKENHKKSANSHEAVKRHSAFSKFKAKAYEIYTTKYKKLMIIPNALLLISFAILFFNLFTTGEFIEKGVSIKGGVAVTIQSATLVNADVEEYLVNTFPKADIETKTLSGAGEQVGLIIEASGVTADELQSALTQKYPLTRNDYTVEVTGSTLGQSFYNQLLIAIVIAFILMGIVVYIYFRLVIPSLAIILAAFSDMITTLAVISLLHMKLTTAGIAAFLMLIGYSVDTDILLTSRVLKRREGTIDDKVHSALITGLTMNAAAIASTSIALLLSHSETIKQIMTILLIGLIADTIYTWIQNVGLLKWYFEKHHNKK